MNKSIGRKQNLLTPEKAATLIPLFVSSIISILIIIIFVMPQYFKSTRVSLELDGLIKKKNKLNNLKSQYKLINEKFDKLNKEKIRITELITGTSKLDTLLARLGEIGENNNIEFISITPKKVIESPEKGIKKKNKKIKNKRKNKNEVNIIVDPLLVEGAKKYEYDLSFKTNFVNLLAFLRELEFQDNVILIDDISIKSLNKIRKKEELDKSQGELEVSINMRFYGRT